VIRPKSIATVVRSLTARPSSLTARSVPTIATSLMVLIRVVLPAENGPVMTIFSGRVVAVFTLRVRRTSFLVRAVVEAKP
jgi:hypothetical protein